MRGHERTAKSHAIRLKGKRNATFFYQCDTSPKIIKAGCAELRKQRPYLWSITYIDTHIPMYVSKANIFILLTLANYGPIYLIDFTNI